MAREPSGSTIAPILGCVATIIISTILAIIGPWLGIEADLSAIAFPP
jgi:hypothetical protein